MLKNIIRLSLIFSLFLFNYVFAEQIKLSSMEDIKDSKTQVNKNPAKKASEKKADVSKSKSNNQTTKSSSEKKNTAKKDDEYTEEKRHEAVSFAQELPPNLELPPLYAFVLMDGRNGQVLLSANNNLEVPPASLTKLMTVYVAFDAIKNGKIKMEDMLTISKQAAQTGGSLMRLKENEQVSLSDLLHGTIILSGNDSSLAIAQHLGNGNEANFVEKMNEIANRLGMSHSHFSNSTGLPAKNHYSSAEDIAKLSYALIKDFPQYYKIYGEKSFTWHGEIRKNRNKLLMQNSQIDGLKTGYTNAAGYCLSATETRDESRLIAVVLGANSENERLIAAQNLLDYGFEYFQVQELLKKDEVVTNELVYRAQTDNVNLLAAESLSLRLPSEQKDKITREVVLDQPIIAPLDKGTKVGIVRIKDDQKIYAEIPLVLANELAKGNFIKRIRHNYKLRKLNKSKE